MVILCYTVFLSTWQKNKWTIISFTNEKLESLVLTETLEEKPLSFTANDADKSILLSIFCVSHTLQGAKDTFVEWEDTNLMIT